MKYATSHEEGLKCALCAEIQGEAVSRFSEVLGGDQTTPVILSQTKRFVALPSLGPLMFGHSLIVTRSHETSILQYANKFRCQDELQDIICNLGRYLKEVTKCSQFLLFENVSRDNPSSLCSTCHAHLHMLPLKEQDLEKVDGALRETFLEIEQSRLYDESFWANEFIVCFYHENGQTTRKSSTYLFQEQNLESQLVRRVLSQTLSLDGWDWKEKPGSEDLRKLVTIASRNNGGISVHP